MKQKLLAILFIIFGLINLVLFIWGYITYKQLVQLTSTLESIDISPNIFGIPKSITSSFIINSIPILTIAITGLVTGILLFRKKELFRIIGTISSGLSLIYVVYNGFYVLTNFILLGLSSFALLLILIPNILLGLFSFVLLLILILNWTKKLQIE